MSRLPLRAGQIWESSSGRHTRWIDEMPYKHGFQSEHSPMLSYNSDYWGEGVCTASTFNKWIKDYDAHMVEE